MSQLLDAYISILPKLTLYQKYDLIQISGFYGFPYIYLLFYSKVDPSFYQKEGNAQKIGKYEFVGLVPRLDPTKNNLYIGPAHQTIEQTKVDEVKSRSNRSIFNFWELR